METKSTKRNIIFSYVIIVALFVFACVLQQTDDLVYNQHISKFMSLLAQSIYFGIITYWMVSVVSRVSDKSIKVGLLVTIILMIFVMVIRLIKYNVLFEATAERLAWYAYYIPQCLAPVVLFLTILKLDRKSEKGLSIFWNLLFLPAILLIFLVFSNDIHQQVFSFAEGLENGNEIYKWEWGYYVILCWIVGLYFTSGILLFVKCRISYCRKKAWIPLTLFIFCISCCILREVFNPQFIKMPETVVFSVVIVCESLIQVGLIPSNTEYFKFFDEANISAVILNKNLGVELSSKNAPTITDEQASTVVSCGEIELSKDIILKSKAIRGGEVIWTENTSVINKIKDNLVEINRTLAEEIDIIAAENRLKEQRSKIEEKNNLYQEIFNVGQPYFTKISEQLTKAKTNEEIDEALRKLVLQGVFLKRKSNLMLINKDGNVLLSELVYAIKEAIDALSFYDVRSSIITTSVNDHYPIEQINLIFDCFTYCIDSSLPNLQACLVNLSNNNDELSCRIVLDGIKNVISNDWCKNECDNLGAKFKVEEDGNTIFVTITIKKQEVQK